MPPDTQVRSGTRLARIVEMLAAGRRPYTAAEIGERLDIPATTVHRLMATLVRLRWVDRASGRYSVGPGLLGVGGLALGRSRLVALARPVLQQVADASGAQSHLAVLAGTRVTYLARAAHHSKRSFHLGAAQPIHCTSAGKLLLALHPEREELLHMVDLRSYTSRTITDLNRLRTELDRIVSEGYSVDTGELSEHWRSTAVPVQGPEGGVVAAAITCGGPPGTIDESDLGWIRDEMTSLTEGLAHQLA